jgi:hypothetical protein
LDAAVGVDNPVRLLVPDLGRGDRDGMAGIRRGCDTGVTECVEVAVGVDHPVARVERAALDENV